MDINNFYSLEVHKVVPGSFAEYCFPHIAFFERTR